LGGMGCRLPLCRGSVRLPHAVPSDWGGWRAGNIVLAQASCLAFVAQHFSVSNGNIPSRPALYRRKALNHDSDNCCQTLSSSLSSGAVKEVTNQARAPDHGGLSCRRRQWSFFFSAGPGSYLGRICTPGVPFGDCLVQGWIGIRISPLLLGAQEASSGPRLWRLLDGCSVHTTVSSSRHRRIDTT
jgi:hypothetical protein